MKRTPGSLTAHAANILDILQIEGADFHTLNSGKVADLLEWADWWGYRKPKNANGSRARYFHDYLQRRARAKE